MLGQRLRRLPNIEPTLNKCTMFEKKSSCPANTRHLYNIYTMSAQRHCVLCLLGDSTSLGVKQFPNPRSNTVCLFVSQRPSSLGAKAKGFELLTHRCRSSIYELAVIWELALNEALGMKRIFSIIME